MLECLMKFLRCGLIIFSCLAANARTQTYQVGVPVCDTISTITRYDESFCHPGSYNYLRVSLDSRLVPYVTGLQFLFCVTAIHGAVSSNLFGAVSAGDTFLIPAVTDSVILSFTLSPNSAFEFVAKIVGTPEIAGEAYPCEISDGITVSLCTNHLIYGVWHEADTCRVAPVSSVHEENETPGGFALRSNYPNPFHLTTEIQYAVGRDELVSLRVYNILGREVATLVNQRMLAGNYRAIFDRQNLPNGIYVIHMTAGRFVTQRKMLALR